MEFVHFGNGLTRERRRAHSSCMKAALTLIYISRNTAARGGREHGIMGCIECEVPAVVTRGRGGERTLEKGKKTEGGI